MSVSTASVSQELETAVRSRLDRSRAKSPVVIGVCGSQGSGKSTACAHVAAALMNAGISTAVLSLDDLYLPRTERLVLARTVHPLLATRGVPGTHEVSLGLHTLEALAQRGPVLLPRFDKARDDREPESRWDEFVAPADVVLFEGWCVGARPQAPVLLEQPINALERLEDIDGRWRRHVNDELAGDYQRLFAQLDFLVLLAAPAFEVVARWRIEQERRLRASRQGAHVMTDAEVGRFVQHYERLTRHILTEMPARADLVLRLDESRQVVG